MGGWEKGCSVKRHWLAGASFECHGRPDFLDGHAEAVGLTGWVGLDVVGLNFMVAAMVSCALRRCAF